MASLESVIATKEPTKLTFEDERSCLNTLSVLLDDTSTHDVTFSTSNGSVTGHRAIVAASSPVFHAMLYGNMREQSEKEIKLPSVDIDTFEVLLSFMYTGKATIDANNSLKLLEAAHYFNISPVETKCMEVIASLVDVQNCCQIATVAFKQNFEGLMGKCLQFMFLRADKVVQESEFKNLPSELVLHFCKSSELYVKDIDLFLAIVEWFKHQETKPPDNVVNDIFQEIRYPLISAADLVENVRPTEMAIPNLYAAALEHHLEPEKCNFPPVQAMKRRLMFKDFSVCTPDTITARKTDEGILITKTGGRGWNALCAMKIDDNCTTLLAKDFPLKFSFLLQRSDPDCSGVQLVLSSTASQSPSSFRGGMDVANLTVGTKYDAVISLDGNYIAIKIGTKIKVTKLEKPKELYFCIFLRYTCNEVLIM